MNLAGLIVMAVLTQGTAQATGSISGRVFDADTKAPLSNVKVGFREGSATTDADGRYTLPNVPPGKRTLFIEDGSMGTTPTPSQAVTVIAGRNVSGVDFHARLLAQVSGRVLDADGNPIVGMQVTANSREYDGYFDGIMQPSRTAELLLSVVRRGLTDDQGRYVIANLRAGIQYWIVASTPKRYADPVSDAPADPLARKRVLAATYFPNASSIETASPILLHSLEQRDGVDIRMSKAESYCLEATLTDGGVPARMRFLLVETAVPSTRLPSINLPGSSESGGDGRIRLCDLYPGRYQLIAARLSAAAQESIGAVDVTISNKDIRDLLVAAIPRSTVSGEFVWDKQQNEASSQSVRIRTYPSPVMQGPLRTNTSRGTFSLDVVVGSSYIAVISGLDSHSYVKDVTYGGSSILHQPFVPSGSDTVLRVTIATDAGSISAAVLDVNSRPVAGAAVLMVPVTSRTEGEVAATFIAGVTDENGTFRAGGIPPGSYDVFATNDPPPGRYSGQTLLIERTPDAIAKIQRARTRGTRMEVGRGNDISVSLATIRLD